jgi:drug/metabolite transporter (DMT)-like permease
MTNTARVFLAYVVLCVVWGSTYLAIRIGVQELPPALFAAVRFLIAGAVLMAWAMMSGRPLPKSRRDWTTNAITGLALLFAANGLVVWAEQFVASGVAAIFVVTVALWLALFDAVVPGSEARVTWSQAIGLLVGLVGCVPLVGLNLEELRTADWRGPVALLLATVFWAAGSVYSKRRPTSSGPHVNAAIQMLGAGMALLVVGTVAGEWSRFHLTLAGVGSVLYLIVFGSIIGYTTYIYVLRHMAPTIAGTYAYVNTVVAVFLGWLVLSEPITGRTVASMAIVIGSVWWVRRARAA